MAKTKATGGRKRTENMVIEMIGSVKGVHRWTMNDDHRENPPTVTDRRWREERSYRRRRG